MKSYYANYTIGRVPHFGAVCSSSHKRTAHLSDTDCMVEGFILSDEILFESSTVALAAYKISSFAFSNAQNTLAKWQYEKNLCGYTSDTTSVLTETEVTSYTYISSYSLRIQGYKSEDSAELNPDAVSDFLCWHKGEYSKRNNDCCRLPTEY